MPRPSKLTKATAEKVVSAVAVGATREVAAALAGVARSTLQSWIVKGEGKNPAKLYRDFAVDLRKAEARREVGALAKISAAGELDWRAHAWWLQHGPARERYVRVDRHELSGALDLDGGWDISKLSDKDLATVQRLAEKADGRD